MFKKIFDLLYLNFGTKEKKTVILILQPRFYGKAQNIKSNNNINNIINAIHL